MGSWDERKLGATSFVAASEAAGFPGTRPFLGVKDLVWQFDDRKREEVQWYEDDAGEKAWRVASSQNKGWEFGWSMALMEMLVDIRMKCGGRRLLVEIFPGL